MKIVLREFAKGIAVTLVFFVIVECFIRVAYFIRNSMVDYIPLPYSMTSDYGPRPPWLENRRLLRPDKTLLWRGQPNLRERYVDIFGPVPSEEELRSLHHQFFPKIPPWLKSHREWTMSTNSEGFRDVEFPKEKPKNVFRIVFLGDSWIVGSNIAQEEASPQRIKALLRDKYPRANFEVFNLGVFGYASYNGLQLLKTRAIQLQPDIVIIAFAMNEANMAGFTNETAGAEPQPVSLTTKIHTSIVTLESILSQKFEIYRLLRYWLLRLSWKPQSFAEHLKIAIGQWSWYEDGMATQKPWMKAALEQYEKHNNEMIDLARSHNANVILLYNEFWTDSPYRAVLQKISDDKKVPLIDTSVLLERAKGAIEKNLEAKLGLESHVTHRASPTGQVEVVFRVYAGERPIPAAMYITGSHTRLGNLEPNKLAMYDDGTHGDQKAGDKVWSYSVSVPLGSTVYYVYTNSGKSGKWEGLDVPAIRSFKVKAPAGESRVYAPIDTFGEMYMHADPWHTNAAGYELVAKALLEILKKNDRVKDYLRRAKSKPLTSSHDR
jgi:lysophospholipase L1-like esterase